MYVAYLIFKFVVGGGLILGITLLANYIHPKWGGIMAVAPVITTLSIVFVRLETDLQTTRELILSAIHFVVPTLLFLVSMYFLVGHLNLLYSFLISYLIWG